MKLNLRELKDKNSYSKEVELELDKESFTSLNNYKIEEPLKFVGTIGEKDNLIFLDGVVQGVLILNCSRCLEEVNYPINVEIHEKLSRNSGNEDEDIIFIHNDIIDLATVLENDILFSIPLKVLCKTDCKGLCQQCGTNKNFDTCSCEDSSIDPRFEKLRDFLNNN